MFSLNLIGKSVFSKARFSPLASLGRAATTISVPSSDDIQRRFRSANASEIQRQNGFFPVYMHHVSKVVLQHLQTSRAEWVEQKGLDSGLHINPNGTFVLKFPSRKGYDAGKIWTSYDGARKQHWLSVYRQKLAVRFLLKDHGQTMKKRLHDSKQTEQQILRAVDQMISAVNQTDAAVSAPRA